MTDVVLIIEFFSSYLPLDIAEECAFVLCVCFVNSFVLLSHSFGHCVFCPSVLQILITSMTRPNNLSLVCLYDIKGVMRSRKLKDRHYTMTKRKRTNNDLQNTTQKTKDWATRTLQTNKKHHNQSIKPCNENILIWYLKFITGVVQTFYSELCLF
jgi:uncharacterized membrane protein YfhO